MTPNSLRHRLRGFGHRLAPVALGRNSNAPDQGLTLIECLVAIIMVALVSSVIAPTMVLSVATRVHSQKSEQALALAQSEIDSVRVLVERGNYTVAQLPPVAPGRTANNIRTTDGANLTAAANNFAHARPVDATGNGQPDFLVQRYRTAGQIVGSTPVAFTMGVRVYDINASAPGNLDIEPASLVMTSGDGGRRTRPLAVLHTTIAVNNQGDSLCNLITFFNSTAAAGQTRPLPTSCTAP